LSYLIFYGENYYPKGGFDDYHGIYATVEDAKSIAESGYSDWAHIVKLDTLTIILYGWNNHKHIWTWAKHDEDHDAMNIT
jgi:hypothetical protein